MQFGVKKKDAPAQQNSGGNGKFIKYFRKGEKELRFLEDTGDWTKFYDHFNQSKQRSFPCTGDRETCPGCTSENEKESKASVRFLTNAVDVETGYVDLWKVPVSIIDDLERFELKDGTMTARTYTVIQFKKEDGIKYSVDRGERVDTPVSDYKDKMQGHQLALQEAYRECWGEDPSDKESPVQAPSKRPAKVKIEKTPEEEPIPFEGGNDVIEEEQLYAMNVDQLKSLFTQAGLDAPETEDPKVLRQELMDALAE